MNFLVPILLAVFGWFVWWIVQLRNRVERLQREIEALRTPDTKDSFGQTAHQHTQKVRVLDHVSFRPAESTQTEVEPSKEEGHQKPKVAPKASDSHEIDALGSNASEASVEAAEPEVQLPINEDRLNQINFKSVVAGDIQKPGKK